MKLNYLYFAFLFSQFCFSQNQPNLSSAEILQGIQKLNTLGTVLYVAAHPDDENTRLLSYLAKEKKLRTAYLSITRGDGGQNLIGKEQGEALGLIRTQELLAARRIDGAEQFFTRANDFGYSKNPAETFKIWDKDSVLSDMVYLIRQIKPDIIICRFPTTGEGGHGHHTASAILASEAFHAAADPNQFTWQLKTTSTWQCKSLYWNTFNFGGTNTTSPKQIKLDVGLFNPLLGKSYGEIAAESRSMHKSQGFGVARQRGSNLEYFRYIKGDSVKADLFENLIIDWSRIPGSGKIQKLIDKCINDFDPSSPEKSVPVLIEINNLITALKPSEVSSKEILSQKNIECRNLIFACSGLWLEANASDYSAAPGQELIIDAQLISRSKTKVILKKINYINQSDSLLNLELKPNEFYGFKRREKIPISSAYSTPYWLEQKHTQGLYSVKSASLIGRPENEAELKVQFDLTINGQDFSVLRNLVYKNADPVKGEVYRPFEVLPALNIQLSEKVYVFNGTAEKNILITVKSNSANLNGEIEIENSSGWKVNLNEKQFQLKQKGDEVQFEAKVTRESGSKGWLRVRAIINREIYHQSIKRIEYDHIPYQFILSEAEANLIHIELKKSDTCIAYIPGAGDEVLACLSQIGYQITTLNDELLAKSDFNQFSAIVCGVRAFNTNNKLPMYHEKFMSYVKQGGNLIIQYNTNSRVGPLQTNIGPYPFTISRERVTDEKAEINFLNDSSAILQFPNKIQAQDFDDWVQERGIYFASDFEKNYRSVIGMKDPGEKENTGSLIFTPFGKGNFIYTGLSFFRQLPAGNSGAYKLMVNLISLPKNDPK